jgi:hypothetical protein
VIVGLFVFVHLPPQSNSDAVKKKVKKQKQKVGGIWRCHLIIGLK